MKGNQTQCGGTGKSNLMPTWEKNEKDWESAVCLEGLPAYTSPLH